MEEQNKKINIQDGILIKGIFSICRGKRIHFSQGNLQYQASTDTWRFADFQCDIIGEDNRKISKKYDGWIDLFGWGTSGYKNKYPYMISEEEDDYGDKGNDIAGTNYDWGVYNKISNGGNKVGIWRTLTIKEWDYIFNGRPHCNKLYSTGSVDGVRGMILLPDDWECKIENVYFSPKAGDWKTNDYTMKEWMEMETYGAVFLPGETPYRFGDFVDKGGNYGSYWSSTAFGVAYYAFPLIFDCENIITLGATYESRHYGRFVRLVQDVE